MFIARATQNYSGSFRSEMYRAIVTHFAPTELKEFRESAGL